MSGTMSGTGADGRFTKAAYIDPTARIYGEVALGEGSSIWPCAVIRAESYAVEIGRFTNIQDLVMIHIGYGRPTIVGEYCSIAHHVTLHGCTIGDNCLIGINATVMDEAEIGDNCIVAGHAYVAEGTVIPDNSVVMGQPATVRRSRNNFVANRLNAMLYHWNALAYARGDHRAWTGAAYEAHMTAVKREIEAMFDALYGDDPLDDPAPLI
jgi:carbonic anhydrase/acetyltransferase-like protein (isoleucine patch superfamily)